MSRFFLTVLMSVIPLLSVLAQNNGYFSGGLESTSHYYLKDENLGIPKPGNPVASNNYLRLQYTNGPFSSALQYEAYMPPLTGYPYQLEGNAVTFLNFNYTKEMIGITAGSFYDQFGSGLSFRSYESRELGINNAVNGLRVILKPFDFVKIKGIYGRPREYLGISSSYIRGADMEFDLAEILNTAFAVKTGGGIISRYQAYTGPADNFPSNVNAYNARLSADFSKFSFETEYVYKSDDPSLPNNYSYNNGDALLFNGNYTSGGFGLFASARFMKNMDFRSDRESEGNYTMVNYLPANTWQHSYLLGNIYPYSTQSEGESSVQAEINYSAQKGTFIGGAYGTKFRLGFSHVRDLIVNENNSPLLISFGDQVYYQDLSMEVNRKWSPAVKTITTFTALQYNKSVIEYPGADFVKAFIVNLESQFRISEVTSLRAELQHLWTKQDDGNWVSALAEFGLAPGLSIFVSDMWDYQNETNSTHYVNSGVSFSKDYFRISGGYGRYREGLICAGGVCQRVPAYRGFNLRLTMNF
jgi:hypothetical protein